MAEKTSRVKTATASGVHPKILAERFGVHLRTIFRWVERGFLRSKDGLIQIKERQIRNALEDWERTYSTTEAVRALGVTYRTLALWRVNGPLEYRHVMGELRYLKTSVDEVQKKIEGKSGSRKLIKLDSDYEYRNRLTWTLGIYSVTLNRLLRDGDIYSEFVKGRRVIPRWAAEKAEAEWFGSCSRTAAARILGVQRSRMPRLVTRGRVEEKVILGKRRILLGTLARTADQKERLVNYAAAVQEKRELRLQAYESAVKNKKEWNKKNADRQRKMRKERAAARRAA